MKRAITGALWVIASLTCPVAAPQDLEKAKQALELIRETANAICNNPPLHGSQQSVELNSAGKAELANLLKKLAVLNMDGGGKYSSSEYEGLLQKDVAGAWKDATACKQKVFDKLSDKLVPTL